MGFSTEVLFQIWDDEHGERVEVGEDRDSLGLVEIRSYDSANKCDHRLTMRKEQAVLVAQAMLKLIGKEDP
jgi:hypothetical protein